jgi:HlyD family secretion protein
METRRIVNIDDVRPRGSRSKRTRTAIAVVLILAAAGALVAAFAAAGAKRIPSIKGYTVATVETADLVRTADSSGTVVVPDKIDVPSPETGYAESLLVAAGDAVAKGRVVATISVPDLVNAKADLEAQLASARIGLSSVSTDYDYQVATLDTSIKRLDPQIAAAQTNVDNKKAMLAIKSSRQSDYDAAADALTALQQKREDAVAQRENALRKRVLDLQKQQASIDQLRLSLDRTNADIESARIKAPMSGEVLSVAAKLSVPGSLINANETLLTIADKTQTFIDFEVDQQYAQTLKAGDSLTATVGASTIIATIAEIGKVASLSSDGLTSTVTVRTRPEGRTSLTPGASAVATVTLGTTAGALILPRGAYLTTGGQKYVYKVEGAVARKAVVEFGDIQGSKVQVKSGLASGDRIITSGYADFIDSDAVDLK